MQPKPLFPLLLLFSLLFVTACDEEFPITEGLLGEREGSSNGNGVEDIESLDELPEALGFEGTFEGETDAARPTDDDDFRFLGEAAFVVWHMERLLQRMDTLVANVGEGESFSGEALWTEGFSAENCGDDEDMTLETSGQDGSLEFEQACLERVNRTDGRALELDGELLWENLRSNEDVAFRDEPVTSRSLFLEDLAVRWRDQILTVSAISELQEDEDRLAIVMDIAHEDSGRSLRLVSTRVPGQVTNAERRIFFDARGVLSQGDINNNWVSATETGCNGDSGAGAGSMTLFTRDEDDSDAQLQMEFVGCDRYNLNQLVEGDGNQPGGGSLVDNELFEVFWN